MKKVDIHSKSFHQKLLATMFSIMIIVSSVTAIDFINKSKDVSQTYSDIEENTLSTKPCDVNSVISQEGIWISFDVTAPGTPAEAHVTISDTSGITIVADFHGFWRNKITLGGIEYDDLDMPETGSISIMGAPKLPCLFEYIEIPHDVNVSVDILGVSSTTIAGYNISPVQLEYPTAVEYGYGLNSSPIASQLFYGPWYNTSSLFPGNITEAEGALNNSTWIIRGHRLLGLSMFPIQYNPVTSELTVYSQMIIKLRYNTPAQIEQIPVRLRSRAFEQILFNTVLNYGSCNNKYTPSLGTATTISSSIDIDGAEYLIITTNDFKSEALRLANWKITKGVPTEVVTVRPGSITDVKNAVNDAYNDWDLVPTYVLILGDVEFIPCCYTFQSRAHRAMYEPMFEDSYLWGLLGFSREGNKGYVASDLGYYTISGSDCFPEMIYSRISVDTEEQAGIIVNKTIQYEQSPTDDCNFYNDMLFAGDFNDRDKDNHIDGLEEESFPFLGRLERIRQYLRSTYNIHINYSCSYYHYDRLPVYDSPETNINLANLKYCLQITNSLGATSDLVMDSISPDYPNFGWLYGYDDPPGSTIYSDLSKNNITPNINEGRFFVLYYGHGGSKNMIYPWQVTYYDNEYNRNDRDSVEGWQFPCFNTTFFPLLTNEDKTPLVVSIACNTGWYDGEKDENVLTLSTLGPPNPFEDYSNECFAENITRLEGGGAIAAISASRPVEAIASLWMMYGIIQAFWPGIALMHNQPIYEMGTALLFSKMYTKKFYSEPYTVLGQVIYDFKNVRNVAEAFNLFGDPETQLWTNSPSQFKVSYPYSMGTEGIQRFAVTVRDRRTDEPISHAKVCIQQKDFVYQVGYTNHKGQVVFNVTPNALPANLNVTVTKHNYKPHIGFIVIHESKAQVVLSTLVAEVGEEIQITFPEFPVGRNIVLIIDNEVIRTDLRSENIFEWEVEPIGVNAYHNVWAAVVEPHLPIRLWAPAAVECLLLTSADKGPDPYIYSLHDPSTWDVTRDTFSWDNPDINVNEETVDVIVHNRGDASSAHTSVALFYAPNRGGFTWYYVDEQPLSGVGGTISFPLNAIPVGSCFRVVLSNAAEAGTNEANNIGYENIDEIELSSPGSMDFEVGNPTTSSDYITIRVKQLGSYGNIWNASICNYTSQVINEGTNETITILVDPLSELGPNEWRLFEVEMFINCMNLGGMVINVTEAQVIPSTTPWPLPIDPELLLLIIGAVGVVIVVGVIYIKKKK